MGFIASVISTALALGLGAWMLGGVELDGILQALIAALLLGVINAALLCLAAWLAPGFAISSFWSALALALIVAVVNAVIGQLWRER